MADAKKFVIDNVVKMEWERKNCLYINGDKGKKIFVYASKDYETKLGVVTVFFDCYTAFIWADNAGTPEEDRYNAKEMKTWVKDNLDEAFPTDYENFIPIIDYGDDKVNQAMVEKYGLEDYVDDIIARLDDVRPYGDEVITTAF